MEELWAYSVVLDERLLVEELDRTEVELDFFLMTLTVVVTCFEGTLKCLFDTFILSTEVELLRFFFFFGVLLLDEEELLESEEEADTLTLRFTTLVVVTVLVTPASFQMNLAISLLEMVPFLSSSICVKIFLNSLSGILLFQLRLWKKS